MFSSYPISTDYSRTRTSRPVASSNTSLARLVLPPSPPTHTLACPPRPPMRSLLTGVRAAASQGWRHASTSATAKSPVNHGAPPRLRLMERGHSYEEASIICRCLDHSAAEGQSYKDGWVAAHEELRLYRAAARQDDTSGS